jgi:hypothetical protein
MYRVDEAKVISLIRGGLDDTKEPEQASELNPSSDGRLNVEKSAEAIVPCEREGPNSSKSFKRTKAQHARKAENPATELPVRG